MFGQRLAARMRFSVARRAVPIGFGRQIGRQVFEPELKLVRIEAFGATPKLRSLERADDQTESFDLAITMLDNHRHLANQPP